MEVVVVPEQALPLSSQVAFWSRNPRRAARAQGRRISDSCGWAVPRYDFVNEQDTLIRWSASEGPARLETFRADLNVQSVDGLFGIPPARRRDLG